MKVTDLKHHTFTQAVRILCPVNFLKLKSIFTGSAPKFTAEILKAASLNLSWFPGGLWTEFTAFGICDGDAEAAVGILGIG